ncbi:MAG: hypothetical protein ACFCUI_07335 [Bernardetiaceae bacterium]
MARFLSGESLNDALRLVIQEARKRLILVSPRIRFHPYYRKLLKVKQLQPHVAVTVLIGKSGNSFTRNIHQKDLDFLCEFPNIRIYCEPLLQAKFYANEKYSLLTTMDFHDLSQEYNVEAGIFSSSNLWNNLFGDAIDTQSYAFFQQIIRQSELIYERVPVYERDFWGSQKHYLDSETRVNELGNTSSQDGEADRLPGT